MASERAIVAGFWGSISSRPAFTAVLIGLQPVACAPKKCTSFSATSPSSISSLNALWIFVIRDPPAELLRYLITHGLRAFVIVRAQVHVDEAPAVLVGDLRAEPVHVIIVAI